MSCQPERVFEPDPDAEDEGYDRERQRKVDDETVAAQRRAAGHSPEELSIQDAHAEGARAGAQGTAAALNPNQHGTPEYDAWERGRSGAERMRLVRSA